MADPNRPTEPKEMVIAAIQAYRAADEAEKGTPHTGVDPADDMPNIISHLRLGFISDSYMEAKRDLILAINQAAYTFPAGGVFHDGNLYLVSIHPAEDYDKDEDGNLAGWAVPCTLVMDTADYAPFVYQLAVIPIENMINVGEDPVTFP